MYSGHYDHDEQVVNKGKKEFRLTLFGVVLNVPAAGEISYTLNANYVKKLLKRCATITRGYPLFMLQFRDDSRPILNSSIGTL